MLEYELLLKAALLDRREALAAWEQWQACTDLNQIDNRSYRLLPLVHRNLKAFGVEHPYMDRLKGVRRRTWLENQLILRGGREALLALHAAGIETMVLRGAANIDLYYKDAGLRPIRDCDVLVPEGKAVDAVRALERAGWSRITPAPAKLTPRFRGFRSSMAFRSSAGVELRLHWHVLSFCCSSSADKEFWRGARPAVLHEVQTAALSPTDQFLHTCLLGLAWSYVPPVWWPADAMMILQSPDRIDAKRIIRFAKEYRLVLLARRALDYLHATLEAPVPPDLLRALSAEPVSRADQLEYECVTQPYRKRSLSAWMVGAYRRHERCGIGTFMGYLACALRWGVLPHVATRVRKQSRSS